MTYHHIEDPNVIQDREAFGRRKATFGLLPAKVQILSEQRLDAFDVLIDVADKADTVYELRTVVLDILQLLRAAEGDR